MQDLAQGRNIMLYTIYTRCLYFPTPAQHNTTQHNATQHNTQYNTTQHNATQCNATQHSTISISVHLEIILPFLPYLSSWHWVGMVSTSVLGSHVPRCPYPRGCWSPCSDYPAPKLPPSWDTTHPLGLLHCHLVRRSELKQQRCYV